MTMQRRTSMLWMAALGSMPWAAQAQAPARRFEPGAGGWRSFELTTQIQVPEVQGKTRLWLPLPSVDNGYQRVVDHQWRGNASVARIVADAQQGVRMLYAEFEPQVGLPQLRLTSSIQTRDRAAPWGQAQRAQEDPQVLRKALQPTSLLPLDGIVARTAKEAIGQARSDEDKVRALFQWVIQRAHREPSTRGCGRGDIKSMLETGNLSGKCADLNALFVGLCRAVGVPARDVYGLRLAPSAFGYKELGANSAKLQGAQHCRAEVFLARYGWVAMDPADVLKVMRQETSEWIKDPAHPVVAPVAKGLFGAWEGNWVAWNTGHDVRLPGSDDKQTIPFLMYPNGENALGRFDELSADAFRYTIQAQALSTPAA